MTPKKDVREAGQRTGLQERLRTLMLDLSVEDLAVLVGNAETLKRNASVRNRMEAPSNTAEAGSTRAYDGNDVEVRELNDGTQFFIRIYSNNNIFTIDEIRMLVAICHSARDEMEGAAKMYGWLKRERLDVVSNIQIQGKYDPALVKIYQYLVSTYTVKK